MLFFFELFLFVLVLLTLALGEFLSRWLALVLWLVVTMFALIGYVLARRSLGDMVVRAAETRRPSETQGPPGVPGGAVEGERAAPAPLDEKWARTLLYNWRRTNVLLVFGALVVGGWYWLGG